jgi:acetylornithine deacetylase/succinyl-diaminopimelate desuccinylase-like protein
MRQATWLLVVALSSVPALAQTPEADVAKLVGSKPFGQAAAFLESDHERFVQELITLTEIPAPSFKEQKRAEAVAARFRALGLSDVEIDQEGNAVGRRPGTGTGPMLAVLAHLDTVFPESTDVKVRRNGTRLMAPGVGDNTRSVALMLSLIGAMNAAAITTSRDILFVGNVGEEGLGNLRGARYLLELSKYKGRIAEMIAVDGGEVTRIVTGGVGSRRYRVTFKGPGGHSYGAYGLVNPAFALGLAIDRFARIPVPSSPKTTKNVGIVGGGQSVNSIPSAMHMEIDMRSESPVELKKLDDAFLRVVREAVEEENGLRSTEQGRVEADVKLLGERPSGETPRSADLVRRAAAAIQAFGMTPAYEFGSTDSNVPISLGIPAITIGRGTGGRAHALDEWVDVEKTSSVKSARVALAIILAAADGR